MTFIIYKLNQINYIGSTNDVKRRKREHKSHLKNINCIHYNYKVYKYARENKIKIKLKILGKYDRPCSSKIQRLVEQFYINKYDSVKNGLNSMDSFVSVTEMKKRKKIQLKKYREKIKKELKKKQKKKEHNSSYYEKTKAERLKIKLCIVCGGKFSYYTKAKHCRTKKHMWCVNVLNGK